MRKKQAFRRGNIAAQSAPAIQKKKWMLYCKVHYVKWCYFILVIVSTVICYELLFALSYIIFFKNREKLSFIHHELHEA